MPDDLAPGAREPLYEQLATILRNKILTGQIGGAVPLPSKRSLTETYGISTRTVDSAMAVLREGGLIETRIGRGLFATPEDEWPPDLRRRRS